ncbi:FMN-binding protein [Bacillus pseudomycoides]|uniref:FMN-binding protein n=1 Tax=Bacillus pseudomycoides TaxID=64104 RepID=UPI000BED74C8|nr:FMN-binding protein [Bacillus pseudomycoides]PEE42644.1 FMN-binding domain-containing protein [Bacillus pseudomycoides]PGA93401.1 FMN-binding domain-containing protein [Bacillus pseudomycoides]PHF50935.1 FMN-binding domain-containing protein [Bacillus pseudomycoides]
MAKMGNKMITLCTVAVGMIYTAGYITTESSKVEVEQTSQNITEPTPQSKEPSTTSNRLTKNVKSTYEDGTYYGQGTNRIGSVAVAVTIQKDKITSVQITDCTTSYSQSYIDDLPQQVLDRQSADVDVVSGATKSTEDFQEAVQIALLQAKQANL